MSCPQKHVCTESAVLNELSLPVAFERLPVALKCLLGVIDASVMRLDASSLPFNTSTARLISYLTPFNANTTHFNIVSSPFMHLRRRLTPFFAIEGLPVAL